MTLQLPEFSVNLNSAEEDIKTLFAKLKPQWNHDKIIIKRLSGGNLSLTNCVHSEDDINDAYVVRVRQSFGNSANTLANPKFEIKVIQEISTKGLFPPIIAIFQNGVCYQFLPGKLIVNMNDTPTGKKFDYDRAGLRAMVEKLAEINSVKLEKENYTQTDFFPRLYELLQNNYKLTSIDKNVLQNEFNEIFTYVDKFDLRVTLCHGDAYVGNVIYNKENDHVTLVDWELAHIGYHVYDVAYCLCLIHLSEIIPIYGLPEFQDEKEKLKLNKKLLKWYFDKWSELNSIQNDYIKFSEFCRQVGYFELIWHFAYIIHLDSVIQTLTPEQAAEIPVDLNEMAMKTFEHYCKIKENRLRDLNLK